MLRRAPLASPWSTCPQGRVTGVQRRDVDAVMLRSAEANPHVTDHASMPGAEAPDFSTWNHPAGTRAEAPMPPLAVELTRRLTWPP